jgi:hypothetical protein
MTLREATQADLEPPRFKLIGFDHVSVSTARTYLIKDIVPKGGLVVVWGAPKSGKSFLTTDMFLHIALGWDYRGHRVEQGSVIYIAAEGGGGVAKRLEAFRQEKMAENSDPVPFHLLASRPCLVLDRDQLIRDIRAQLAQQTVSAVVVDTLNRTYKGSESNDADMTSYIEAADAIREAFNCTVVVIHHCGLDTTRPRGHTSLLGALDAQIAVSRDAQDNIIAQVEHMRDGEDGVTWANTLRQVVVGIDEDGDDITCCVVDSMDDYQAPKKGERKMPAQQAVALDMLRKATDEAGETPPASEHIPPNTRCVSVNMWRRYCEQGTVTDSDKPGTRQRAFKRAVDGLQKNDVVRVWGEWAWIV